MSKIYVPRTSPPEQNNKYYRLIAGGGYSPCIAGRPNYASDGKSALNNCVGYCWGRASETEQDPTIKIGCFPGHSYPSDAYVWLQYSAKQGFKTGLDPKLGATAVWVNNRNKKKGHVATVEKINADGTWVSSESGYDCTPSWWSKTYSKTSYKAGYTFKGFVYLPTDWKEKDELVKGDKVKIIGKGNSRSDGKGLVAGGVGYIRYINDILVGRPYPYKVGSAAGVTTGYYTAEALEKL